MSHLCQHLPRLEISCSNSGSFCSLILKLIFDTHGIFSITAICAFKCGGDICCFASFCSVFIYLFNFETSET